MATLTQTVNDWAPLSGMDIDDLPPMHEINTMYPFQDTRALFPTIHGATHTGSILLQLSAHHRNTAADGSRHARGPIAATGAPRTIARRVPPALDHLARPGAATC
jgi:hypothetical protein